MKENEKQFHTELDADLIKRVNIAAINEDIPLKKWTANALELALNFHAIAEEYCKDIGWSPPEQPTEDIKQFIKRHMTPTVPSDQASMNGTGVNDIDAVNVKNNREFLKVLGELCTRLKWGKTETEDYLKEHYPTTPCDLMNLPIGMRRSFLKDLRLKTKLISLTRGK